MDVHKFKDLNLFRSFYDLFVVSHGAAGAMDALLDYIDAMGIALENVWGLSSISPNLDFTIEVEEVCGEHGHIPHTFLHLSWRYHQL